MNKIYYLVLVSLALSCIDKHKSIAPKAKVKPLISQAINANADTLKMDIEKSRIKWIATEMMGLKSRTGIISFKKGFFLLSAGEIVGGNFMVDMETIDVTDVPVHEKTARKNVLNHLKSDDFFNVNHFPLSIINLVNVHKSSKNSLLISGNLQIREVTKNIEFRAERKGNNFSTKFTINRLDWNVAYEGSWIDKTLVDKNIALEITIQTK